MFYRNYHCKHIVFGGADSGYAGFLNTFINVSGNNDRITFLDGPLTPHHLQRISKAFRNVTFRDLFRPAKIVVNSTNGTLVNGTKRPAPEPLEQPYRRPRSPHSIDEYDPTSPAMIPPWAGPHLLPASLPPPITPGTIRPFPAIIYQNMYGQRLDPPVKYDKDFLGVLFSSKKKLCNNFYLKGHCTYGDSCSWDHSERLSELQLDTLRHKARTSACREPFCKDPDCTLGHMCPRGDKCNISLCKYLPEMHSIDMRQVFEYSPATQSRVLVHQEG